MNLCFCVEGINQENSGSTGKKKTQSYRNYQPYLVIIHFVLEMYRIAFCYSCQLGTNIFLKSNVK